MANCWVWVWEGTLLANAASAWLPQAYSCSIECKKRKCLPNNYLLFSPRHLTHYITKSRVVGGQSTAFCSSLPQGRGRETGGLLFVPHSVAGCATFGMCEYRILGGTKHTGSWAASCTYSSKHYVTRRHVMCKLRLLGEGTNNERRAHAVSTRKRWFTVT